MQLSASRRRMENNHRRQGMGLMEREGSAKKFCHTWSLLLAKVSGAMGDQQLLLLLGLCTFWEEL